MQGYYRDSDPGDLPRSRLGQTIRILVEVDDQGGGNVAVIGKVDDPDAAKLHLAGDRVGRRGDESAVPRRDDRIIVADQGRAAIDQAKREVGLARPGSAEDQNRPAADGHGGRVGLS